MSAKRSADGESKVRTDIGRYAIVPEWLLDCDVSAHAIRLFAVLAAKYADLSTGQAFPGRSRLRRDMGNVSLDTVDRAVLALKACCALHVENRTDPADKRVHLTNLYTLTFARPATISADLPVGSRTDADTPVGKAADWVAAPVRTNPDVRTQTHSYPERDSLTRMGTRGARPARCGVCGDPDAEHATRPPRECTRDICKCEAFVPALAAVSA